MDKFYRFLFNTNPGKADSVTSTFAAMMDVLNKGDDYGPSDGLFGIYDGYKTTAYMLYVPAMWDGSFSEHVRSAMDHVNFNVCAKDRPTECSQNLVISMQSECHETEQYPRSITLTNGSRYDLAGVVYGNGWHATAIVTNEVNFTMCNDDDVFNTEKCQAQGSLMVFFTKSESDVKMEVEEKNT